MNPKNSKLNHPSKRRLKFKIISIKMNSNIKFKTRKMTYKI